MSVMKKSYTRTRPGFAATKTSHALCVGVFAYGTPPPLKIVHDASVDRKPVKSARPQVPPLTGIGRLQLLASANTTSPLSRMIDNRGEPPVTVPPGGSAKS